MNNFLALGKKAYGLFVTAASFLQSPLLLFIRVYWGWQLFVLGKGKLGDIPKVVQFFTELNIPFPSFNAHFVAGVETFGGLLLLVGLASRPVGLVLAVNMLVAYLTADREALFSIFSDPDKFTAAAPYQFLFAALVVLIFGPGKASLDWVIGRVLEKRTAGA
jgi:putative oxidoreductase